MAEYNFEIAGEPSGIRINKKSVDKKSDGQQLNTYQVTIGDKAHNVVVYHQDSHTIGFVVNGRYVLAHLAEGDAVGERLIRLHGQTWAVTRIDSKNRRRSQQNEQLAGTLTASMPGQVQAVLVSEGDSVQKGDPLIILEAMKMEMRVASPEDGVVKTLHCSVGDVVARGQLLVEIETT